MASTSNQATHHSPALTGGLSFSMSLPCLVALQASAYFQMDGRVFFDMQRIIQTTHALRTYTLQEVGRLWSVISRLIVSLPSLD
jgi:hypothetical protein